MSYQVIARKYRPQVFDDVVGQRVITDTLKNAILNGRVAHGYIFSGARGVGKTTSARILAKALNCVKGPTVTPCGECPSCVETAAGNSVDVVEIDAASNRGIDEIRELRENVRYLPARDRYKVFIIDEAHMLTTEAFNALLKTLEEPPPRSLFILATTEPHKLPVTVQSRCQHFSFRLLHYQEILARLQWVCAQEKVKADEGALSAVAEAGEGSMRDALSLLDQVIASCGHELEEAHVRRMLGVVPTKLLAEMTEAILEGNSRRVLEQVDQLASEGYELSHFCGEFTRYVRNLMVAKSCGAESALLQIPSSEKETLALLANRFGEEDLARFFQVLLRTEGEMRYSIQPRFHLEMGLVKLVHARKLVALETLLTDLRNGGPTSSPPGEVRERPATQGMPRRDVARTEATAPLATPEIGQDQGRRPEPAPKPETAISLPNEEVVSARTERIGDDAALAAIKSLLFNQSKKFLSSCLEHLAYWHFEDGLVQFYFGKNDSWVVDLLRSREQLDSLRLACEQVLGQSVKVCAKISEESGAAPTSSPQVRDRAERDRGVEALRKRFNCTLVDVQDLSQE
jgi:DNA polymerase-3 subunit gamma/tau